MKVPDDCVRINMGKNGLTAFLADGSEIPMIYKIEIESSPGELVTAKITVVANVADIEEWDRVMSKEIVVQKTLTPDDFLKLVNK